ncbi:MAG TPA: PP2C family protein-serine/threonine phosphatase [Armatimonadota bacterium]|nr:PP2C family protein-serine/threonine phosphatase [Armatimonadota bacterium]
MQQEPISTKVIPDSVKRIAGAVQGAWRWISADSPGRGAGSVLGASFILSLCLALSDHTLRENPGGIFLYLFIVLWAAFRWGYFHAIFATALAVAAEAIWTVPTWADAALDTPNDLRIAVFVFTALGISALLAGVRREERNLRSEYETQHALAIVFQRALLPDASEPPGYDIAFAYQPASRNPKVGGDFIDVFNLGRGRYVILLGDVTGHGIEAAVHTAEIRYGLRALAFGRMSPPDCIAAVNEMLAESPYRDRYATAFLGIMDTTAHSLVYSNAGHDAGLLWRAPGGPLEELSSTGLMLGVIHAPTATYEGAIVEIGLGDGLVLYSDGVTEARGADGFFGTERLQNFVLQQKMSPAAAAVDALLSTIGAFTKGDLQDDVAILWIRRRE